MYKNHHINLLQQQLAESYNIMIATNNPDTLLERRDFGFKRIADLRVYEKQGLYKGDKNADYWYSLYYKNSYSAIFFCYKRYIEKAEQELKTVQGIEKRKNAFWEIVEKYLGCENTMKLKESMN